MHLSMKKSRYGKEAGRGWVEEKDGGVSGS